MHEYMHACSAPARQVPIKDSTEDSDGLLHDTPATSSHRPEQPEELSSVFKLCVIAVSRLVHET